LSTLNWNIYKVIVKWKVCCFHNISNGNNGFGIQLTFKIVFEFKALESNGFSKSVPYLRHSNISKLLNSQTNNSNNRNFITSIKFDFRIAMNSLSFERIKI
jgi:hypothetical protein